MVALAKGGMTLAAPGGRDPMRRPAIFVAARIRAARISRAYGSLRKTRGREGYPILHACACPKSWTDSGTMSACN